MTNPIGGPIPPESPRSSRGVHGPDGGKFQKQMRRVEEVEKVSEAELDKQRKRLKKKPVEEEGEAIETREPSPFEAKFHLPKPPLGFSELDESSQKGVRAMQTPAPRMQSMPSAKMAPLEEPLPESEEFWRDYDLPDEPPEPPHFEERRHPKSAEQPLEKKAEKEWKGSALPKHAAHAEKHKPAAMTVPSQKTAPQIEKTRTSKKEGAYISEEQLEEVPLPGEKEEPEIPMTPKWGGAEERSQLPYPETAIAAEKLESEKERQKKKAKLQSTLPVHPPEPLPAACQKVAESSLISASPFLNPRMADLYIQMVGTMTFMSFSQGGVSLTEVTLNSPAFANSVFFNSTIIIEKYATAPDSFNIRLTGTPEAVQLFSNNVGSLSSAFVAAYEDRRISFRVGRIEAELAPNRPLIRRKKEGGSKENLT